MNFLRLTVLFCILFMATMVHAQRKFTLSGNVSDGDTGEDLIGVTIYTADKTLGTQTNTYGFYSLTLPEGNYEIVYASLGYAPQTRKVKLIDNQTINAKLTTTQTNLSEVEVTAEKRDVNLTSNQMGVEKLDMKEVGKLPVLFGEIDLLKTIQLLPGISSVSEGGSGYSVRGGAIDQNLILLDEAPVYSASHLLGFFSVFNADAIKGMTVYKGGIPANYGGRASSVLDITMRDGNNQKFAASGGVGLISSRLTLEGPIVQDKVSYIISGRRSYADLVAKALDIIPNDAGLYFYDFNAKVNYKINDHNRLYLSGYFGRDDFGFEDFGMSWGNATGTIRLNHLFSNRLFSNTTGIFSDYSYGFKFGGLASMSSGIRDIGLKQDFTWFANPTNNVKFGFNAMYHTFYPGEFLFEDEGVSDIVIPEKQALETAIYITNEQKFNEVLSADYGLRLSMFNQFGPGDNNDYNAKNIVVSQETFQKGELMQNYFEYEPRVSINRRINTVSSVKASYNRMAQYLHMLSNSTSGQPTDVWTPSAYNIKPVIANQYAVGYFRNFLDNIFECSVETYYKSMANVTDFEDATQVLLNQHIDANILQGEGRSYGAEFYIKKRVGDFTGWVSYTLSKTENQIEGINSGEWYASAYDKTNDVSVVASYQISKRMSLSTNWVFYTGNAVTFPSGKYWFDGKQVPYYTERNAYRMPNYHRLDLNLHLEGKGTSRFKSSWDFSVYNVYNQMNAYSINFRESVTEPGATEAVKLSLFGIVPSVTWNFKF